MNIITAVMKWRWRRAGKRPGKLFLRPGYQCAGFPWFGRQRKNPQTFRFCGKVRGDFLKNAADSGQFAGVFQEKYGWCGSFTNCSHQAHNSVKIIGYCIIKQRVLPTRCVFSLLKHTAKTPRRAARGFCVSSLVIVRLIRQGHGQAVVIHRHQLEFEAAGPVEPVDLFLYCRVHDALADILVDSVVGKARLSRPSDR
mgnify:CR=1 FL=1